MEDYSSCSYGSYLVPFEEEVRERAWRPDVQKGGEMERQKEDEEIGELIKRIVKRD